MRAQIPRGGPPGVVGVILAGGRSSRMGGGDKCLLDLGGRRILDHVVSRLRSQVRVMAISANGDPARFGAWDLPILADGPPAYRGPLAGVLAGMDWAASLGVPHVFTVAADTPFFPRDLVVRLSSAPGAIVLAATEGDEVRIHPTFGLWPVSLRDALRRDLDRGLRRLQGWAEAQGASIVTFPAVPEDPFFNINTPQDLVEAARRL